MYNRTRSSTHVVRKSKLVKYFNRSIWFLSDYSISPLEAGL
ncbi:hypothetical protein CPT_Moabite_307 [Serratia phage Moabite]|uniref:Uncharacterized protein n=1 Tax=Serratia phage Moabite TaxID=2587814 RepID=A0A4Y5TPN2_9CAUD|nr:hypothetical protein HWC48_gp109 [Serratia phage Moabite]QDB71337.1 hypothetical protein CPT_Moabite_307 [Serratia phage Moabite]